jgi:hypothetical protein
MEVNVLMTTPKRKIKAGPFIRDLRSGIGDRQLMEKYSLSDNQLHKVLKKLVDAGAIDELELFMRTSLSDSTVTKAFVEIQSSAQELNDLQEVTPAHSLEAPSDITITERVKTIGKLVGGRISGLARTG